MRSLNAGGIRKEEKEDVFRGITNPQNQVLLHKNREGRKETALFVLCTRGFFHKDMFILQRICVTKRLKTEIDSSIVVYSVIDFQIVSTSTKLTDLYQ